MFMSTVTAKIDAKGRVSVPAALRAVIASQSPEASGQPGIFVYPSFTLEALEGGGRDLMQNLNAMVDQLDPFSEERDALAASLFGDSYHLTFDADGRVSLPEPLLQHAVITTHMCFVGLGEKFQIWEPERFTAFRADARRKALENRNLLRSLSAGQREGQ
jgi:MraZ protein